MIFLFFIILVHDLAIDDILHVPLTTKTFNLKAKLLILDMYLISSVLLFYTIKHVFTEFSYFHHNSYAKL